MGERLEERLIVTMTNALADREGTRGSLITAERAKIIEIVHGPLAAAARAHFLAALPRDAIIRHLIEHFGLDCHVCDPKWYGPIADALLALLKERIQA